MPNIFRIFDEDLRPADVMCRGRKVPSQPASVTPGKVYMGSDIGEIDYQGDRPRPGDLVMIVGDKARKFAETGAAVPSMRAPTFGKDCRCKCLTVDGQVFWANPLSNTPMILVLDDDGTLRQVVKGSQLFKIAGIAVDAESPFNMYVLDDRTLLENQITDATPDTQTAGKSTYCLHTYTFAGGAYSWSSVIEMADPGLPASPFFFDERVWVTDNNTNGQLEDPPAAWPANCMTVINGLLYITKSIRPARYMTFNGASFTTHNLTEGGSNLNLGLRGQIVKGLDKPGKAALFYVLAWHGADRFSEDGSGYEIVQFTADDVVTKRLSVTSLASPTQLMIVCNRLVVLNTDYMGRTSFDTGSNNGDSIPQGSPP
jgi:hypothetical protein